MHNSEKARAFAALHIAGEPLVLYNIWDAGSAQAVARAGAKAVATGSASVAEANGLDDGEAVPLALALNNARRIAAAVDLPVTVDFEGGYSVEADAVGRNVAVLAETGAIGCNFEDQIVGGDGLHSIELQYRRIAAARQAAPADFFINARTDIFLQAKPGDHDAALVDAALDRARAYADAGANGFFVPLLADLQLVERVCRESPIPVNAMAFPGAPTDAEWASAGVARISYGPFPYRSLRKQLEEAARAALGSGAR
jgi:2-methylisocitrate lyase-like PEP mutase family enzyme